MGERAQWPPHQVTTTPEPSDWLPRFREKLRGYEVQHVWYDEAPNFDPPEGFRGFPGRVGGRRAGRTAEAVRSVGFARGDQVVVPHWFHRAVCELGGSEHLAADYGKWWTCLQCSEAERRLTEAITIPEAADARVDCGWRPLTIEELTWPHPL